MERCGNDPWAIWSPRSPLLNPVRTKKISRFLGELCLKKWYPELLQIFNQHNFRLQPCSFLVLLGNFRGWCSKEWFLFYVTPKIPFLVRFGWGVVSAVGVSEIAVVVSFGNYWGSARGSCGAKKGGFGGAFGIFSGFSRDVRDVRPWHENTFHWRFHCLLQKSLCWEGVNARGLIGWSVHGTRPPWRHLATPISPLSLTGWRPNGPSGDRLSLLNGDFSF